MKILHGTLMQKTENIFTLLSIYITTLSGNTQYCTASNDWMATDIVLETVLKEAAVIQIDGKKVLHLPGGTEKNYEESQSQ
jgi:hypothetical protein